MGCIRLYDFVGASFLHHINHPQYHRPEKHRPGRRGHDTDVLFAAEAATPHNVGISDVDAMSEEQDGHTWTYNSGDDDTCPKSVHACCFSILCGCLQTAMTSTLPHQRTGVDAIKPPLPRARKMAEMGKDKGYARRLFLVAAGGYIKGRPLSALPK